MRTTTYLGQRLLEKDGYIYRENSVYYVSPKPFRYDREHYQAITQIRREEIRQMLELSETRSCYSRFVTQAMDDPAAADCGHCANCLGRMPISPDITPAAREAAAVYMGGLILSIEPRKLWMRSDCGGYIKPPNQPGICLSKYGDPGFGELVKRGKYGREQRFCDELVGKSASVLAPLVREKGIRYLTHVPSLRSGIVEDFARRLAASLSLQFLPLLVKKPADFQKEMENSVHQCENAWKSFTVAEGARVPEKLLLVDDVVDSRWTLTVCGYRLAECGCREVYPFALADSSRNGV